MHTIETTATVTEDRKLTIEVPADIAPGAHRVIVIIDEGMVPSNERAPLQLAAYPVGLTSDNFTFRREDLYDDDGR